MKTMLAVLVLAALASACRKKVPEVETTAAPAASEPAPQNAVTGYVSGLQKSVEKAQSTADKANAAIEARQRQQADPGAQ